MIFRYLLACLFFHTALEVPWLFINSSWHECSSGLSGICLSLLLLFPEIINSKSSDWKHLLIPVSMWLCVHLSSEAPFWISVSYILSSVSYSLASTWSNTGRNYLNLRLRRLLKWQLCVVFLFGLISAAPDYLPLMKFGGAARGGGKERMAGLQDCVLQLQGGESLGLQAPPILTVVFMTVRPPLPLPPLLPSSNPSYFAF